MSIKILFDEWFHPTPNLILTKWGKIPAHHLSILGIELGSLGCTTACPTTEPRLSLQRSLIINTQRLITARKLNSDCPSRLTFMTLPLEQYILLVTLIIFWCTKENLTFILLGKTIHQPMGLHGQLSYKSKRVIPTNLRKHVN